MYTGPESDYDYYEYYDPPRVAGRGEWNSARGVLRIRDMDDSHIANCVALLERRYETKCFYGWHDLAARDLAKLLEFTAEMRRRTKPPSVPARFVAILGKPSRRRGR